MRGVDKVAADLPAQPRGRHRERRRRGAAGCQLQPGKLQPGQGVCLDRDGVPEVAGFADDGSAGHGAAGADVTVGRIIAVEVEIEDAGERHLCKDARMAVKVTDDGLPAVACRDDVVRLAVARHPEGRGINNFAQRLRRTLEIIEVSIRQALARGGTHEDVAVDVDVLPEGGKRRHRLLVILRIHLRAGHDLPLVSHARRLPRLLTRPGEYREKYCGEDGNNGNHDQQFDKGETFLTGFHRFSPLTHGMLYFVL